MTLRDYLEWRQIRVCDFAERIGVSEVQLARYVRVTPCAMPRPNVMRRIVNETVGAVTPNDFYGLSVGAEGGCGRPQQGGSRSDPAAPGGSSKTTPPGPDVRPGPSARQQRVS